MASAKVLMMEAQLVLLDGQINTLLNQQVLLDHSIDGQSLQGNANLDRLMERKDKLLVRLFKAKSFEIVTRTQL